MCPKCSGETVELPRACALFEFDTGGVCVRIYRAIRRGCPSCFWSELTRGAMLVDNTSPIFAAELVVIKRHECCYRLNADGSIGKRF